MDLSTANENLQTWEKAQTAVSTGTSYSIGGRSLTRADINDINNMITYYRREVKRLSGQTTFLTPSWT
jgi:hypothetical protein